MKVSQAMIDAVKSIMEAGWEKEKTSTGMKVYGSNYGNSKKARKDQTKSAVDDVKEPSKKELGEEKEEGHEDAAEDKSMCKDVAKKEVKKHEKKMHNESFKDRLLGSIVINEEEINQQIDEVLSKDASAGDWIHDFVHSDNPKFVGKSKAMRKKMALAAYYAKQRNEETEIEEELKGKQYKLDKNKNGKLDSDDFKKLRKEEKDDCECEAEKEGHDDEKEDKALVKKLVKKDALKNEEMELDEGRMKDIATDREESNRLNVPKKNTDVADKSYLKTAGKKPGPLHNVGKGLKAFLKGKPEPMESVEVDGEQLDEVSSSTLKSYINKAKPEMKSARDERQSARATGDLETADSARKLADKRKEGIKTAKEKLNKEEVEQIDEISLDTMKSAKEKLKDKAFDAHMDDNKYGAQHYAKRAIKITSRIKKKEREMSEGKQPDSEVPFAPPYTTTSDDVVTDKSGAKHTPMSRAKDLARTAMSKIKKDLAGKK